VPRVETVLFILLIVVIVGGWLAIHRARRRQLRAEASEAKDKKKAQR
jgi:cytochrome c-type biogenesis protein CcmH/NrfF